MPLDKENDKESEKENEKEKSLRVYQAFDGQEIETIAMQNWQTADEMLQHALHLFEHRALWLSAHERSAVLTELTSLMSAQKDELALLIAREGGKPLTDAIVEVSRAINGVVLAKEHIGQLAGKQIPMALTEAGYGRLALTIKEPMGVVLALSAFNHPLNLIVHQVVPAIASGCPIIIKPAANTPLSCLRFVEMVNNTRLPAHWVQCCICDRDTTNQMVADKRIAFLSFIGSAKVGWQLRRQIADGTRCALEHGGVAPVIITEDADLDKALPALVKGAYYHAGQVCVSVQRIFVARAILTTFLSRFVALVAELKVGDPTHLDTDVGPLIKPSEVTRVHKWVSDAIDAGAELRFGGKKINDYCYQPTVLLDPSIDAMVSTQEVFGPVACVYGYDKLEEALSRANALPFSFQASVFCQDINIALKTAKILNAAAVMINDHTAFRVDWMPFAGHKTSGLGIGGIGYTMEDMTQDKLLVINHGS